MISCMPVMQRHLVMFHFCVNTCVLAKEVTLEKKCFSLKMTCYFQSFSVVLIGKCQNDTPRWLFLYWVDYSHQSSSDININNYVLELPSLRELSVWCDGIEVKWYEPKKNEVAIDLDKIYQDFIEWTGRTINTKTVWMNGKTIIPIKIDPSPAAQVKDPDNYTLRETAEIDIKQVFNGRPHN